MSMPLPWSGNFINGTLRLPKQSKVSILFLRWIRLSGTTSTQHIEMPHSRGGVMSENSSFLLFSLFIPSLSFHLLSYFFCHSLISSVILSFHCFYSFNTICWYYSQPLRCPGSLAIIQTSVGPSAPLPGCLHKLEFAFLTYKSPEFSCFVDFRVF